MKDMKDYLDAVLRSRDSPPISVDKTAWQLPAASQRTAGLLYGQCDSAAAAAARPPCLSCPACGQVVDGVDGLVTERAVVYRTAGGSQRFTAVPPCPVAGLSIPGMLFAAAPCGCPVTNDWAGRFAVELNDRLAGCAGKFLAKRSGDFASGREMLTGWLVPLYEARDKAAPGSSEYDVASWWLTAVLDQLRRLCPPSSGGHAEVPTVALAPPEGVVRFCVGDDQSSFGYGQHYPMPLAMSATAHDAKKAARQAIEEHACGAAKGESTNVTGFNRGVPQAVLSLLRGSYTDAEVLVRRLLFAGSTVSGAALDKQVRVALDSILKESHDSLHCNTPLSSLTSQFIAALTSAHSAVASPKAEPLSEVKGPPCSLPKVRRRQVRHIGEFGD